MSTDALMRGRIEGGTMEDRQLNLIVQRPGGTAGKGAYSFKISLPSTWVYEMGLSADSRRCIVSFDGESITIKKASETTEKK